MGGLVKETEPNSAYKLLQIMWHLFLGQVLCAPPLGPINPPWENAPQKNMFTPTSTPTQGLGLVKTLILGWHREGYGTGPKPGAQRRQSLFPSIRE